MSIRCISETPDNIKELNALVDKFPSKSYKSIKAFVEAWQSETLKENEDRFPTGAELNAYIQKSKRVGKKITSKQGYIPEREFYTKLNKTLQNLIDAIDKSGIKEAKAARNLYSWTIQANQAVIDAINSGERNEENLPISNVISIIDGLSSKTPKKLAEDAVKALKEMSREWGGSSWARTSDNNYEVSSRGDKRFSALVATFNKGTIIDGVDVGGRTIEDVYQSVIKKSRKGQAPSKDSKLNLDRTDPDGMPTWLGGSYENKLPKDLWHHLYGIYGVPEYEEKLTKENREDFSYYIGYLPLWQEWARQNPQLIDELRIKAQGKTLTDQFANTRVSQARALAEILNEQYQQEEISTPEVQSFAEDIAKVSQTFNPVTRRNIVNKISRMFSNEVSSRLEEKKAELNRRIDAETDFIAKRELIDELKELSRFKVIKKETPYELFKEVEKIFRIYAEASLEDRYAIELEFINSDPENNNLPDKVKENIARTKATRKGETYKKILENFQALAEEASSNFALTEGISMDINPQYNYVVEDTNTDSVDENGETQYSSVENKEEQYKDGWMTNVREVSSFSSLSNRVRRSISNIARINRRGTQEKDEFGDTMYLEPSYVHAELIQALRDMVTAEDMIPMLEKLAQRKIWAKQVVTEVKNDPRLFTSFYRAYRKDYLNYWIQKQKTLPDGSMKFQTISINKSEGTAHYFDEWRDNYEFGNILDPDSLYDKDGNINLSKAEIGLNLVNELIGKFPRGASREEEIAITNDADTIKKLQKALGMLGISVDDNTLTNGLNFQIEDTRFPISIRQMLDNLRTIYYDLNKGTEKIVDGKPADLINIYGTAFNNIAEIINNVDEDSVESNVRQGDKTRYAHTNPSYLTTLIKKFKRDDFKKFIENEFKHVNWFYDEKTGWKNEWLKELESNPEARERLDHIVLLEFNKKEYAQWSELDATLALINQYFSSPTKNEEGYAYYQIPMLSDSQSAEFIRGKRYISDYENILTDKFVTLVKQEIERISLVNKRYNNNADEIANFDRVKKKDGSVSIGGAEFKFFPELNRAVYGINNDKTFIDVYNDMVSGAATNETIDTFIKQSISTIMEDRFALAKANWKKIGLFDRVSDSKDAKYLYFEKFSEKGVEKDLREWYWNSTFAQSQIIQLLTTDLAYYKNLEDFQKRNKQVHAPSERLNTFATWNKNGVEVPVLERVPLKDDRGNLILDEKGNKILVPRKERTIYLKDSIVKSVGIKDIEEIVDAKIKKGELTAYDKSVIMSAYKKVNTADAQAYRSLNSFRATQIMADMWSEEEEEAYNNFKNNKWSAKDFTVLWNTRKPFLYTQVNQSNQVDDGLIRKPTQNKNSEMLLLTQAMFGQILASGKLRALSDFMEENKVDVVQFESTVKDGKQGVIDINDLDDNDYTGVKNRLTEAISNPNYLHEFDYNDYGIQTATPEHGIDAVQLVGTQIRRLISADMDSNAKFNYGGREWTKDQWFNYYNAVNVANIRTAFEALDRKFKDPKEIEKELLREVRSNPRYGTDLIQAISLNEKGKFNIPLSDPSQTLRIQSLLNSILKSKVTKQKIQGGALIQASAYGLERKPRYVYEGKGENKRLKYVECYIPCPTEELYNLLLDPETHELNIDKKDSNGNYIVPRKYLEVIGYRV